MDPLQLSQLFGVVAPLVHAASGLAVAAVGGVGLLLALASPGGRRAPAFAPARVSRRIG